jgi:hypothetical protein
MEQAAITSSPTTNSTMEATQVTSSEAIIKVLTGSRKQWSAVEITEAGLPLTTGLKGKDPRHTFYMNLYKEAKRPDGLVIRYQGTDGKTLFKLNPKRRDLTKKVVPPKAKAKKAPAKKATPRKRGAARTPEQVEAAKDAASDLLERAAEADTPQEAATLEAAAAKIEAQAFGEDA